MQYWFKRRRYGYGWIPVTWQGWLLVALLIVVIALGAPFMLGPEDEITIAQLIRFAMFLAVTVSLFIFITAMHAPKAKWRWGKSPDDNPEEDW